MIPTTVLHFIVAALQELGWRKFAEDFQHLVDFVELGTLISDVERRHPDKTVVSKEDHGKARAQVDSALRRLRSTCSHQRGRVEGEGIDGDPDQIYEYLMIKLCSHVTLFYHRSIISPCQLSAGLGIVDHVIVSHENSACDAFRLIQSLYKTRFEKIENGDQEKA